MHPRWPVGNRRALAMAALAACTAVALAGCGTATPAALRSRATATTGSTASAAAGAASVTGRIVSGIDASLCLEQVGAAADLEPCSSSAAQQWVFSNARSPTPDGAWDQIRNLATGGYLDINGNFTGPGGNNVTVSAHPADINTAQWNPAASGVLENLGPGGRFHYCLYDPNSSTVTGSGTPSAGTQLDVWTCDGSAGEVWRLPVSG